MPLLGMKKLIKMYDWTGKGVRGKGTTLEASGDMIFS